LSGIPIGWWLLNLGLILDLHKYEKVYSGVQFLLGPDRTHTLSSSALFITLGHHTIQYRGRLGDRRAFSFFNRGNTIKGSENFPEAESMP
jgi:hypothetical protein